MCKQNRKNGQMHVITNYCFIESVLWDCDPCYLITVITTTVHRITAQNYRPMWGNRRPKQTPISHPETLADKKNLFSASLPLSFAFFSFLFFSLCFLSFSFFFVFSCCVQLLGLTRRRASLIILFAPVGVILERRASLIICVRAVGSPCLLTRRALLIFMSAPVGVHLQRRASPIICVQLLGQHVSWDGKLRWSFCLRRLVSS